MDKYFDLEAVYTLEKTLPNLFEIESLLSKVCILMHLVLDTLSKYNERNEDEYNSQIEKIASLIIKDETSLDEQDPKKLEKYYHYVKSNFKMEGDLAVQLVNEAFLYLKLQNAEDVDPIKKGDQFGAGFS